MQTQTVNIISCQYVDEIDSWSLIAPFDSCKDLFGKKSLMYIKGSFCRNHYSCEVILDLFIIVFDDTQLK